jgi:peptidoglycan/xylan/chitin deacetylase (PgdA/CDA1 family)
MSEAIAPPRPGATTPTSPFEAGAQTRIGVTVLMYHAMSGCAHEPDRPVDGADPYYAVTQSHFAEQLAMLAVSGQAPTSVQRLLQDGSTRGVALTFDDGHESNAWAADLLAQRGGAADFFVNPSTVGTRHHLSWTELRSMAAAGMSIQSHGWSHRYLDELHVDQVHEELVRSKATIEDRLGQPVTLFAPPGGRQPRGFARLAQQAGYERVCSSRVDVWRVNKVTAEVPRVAVVDSTTAEQFWRWIVRDDGEFAHQRRRHRLLALAKRVLGNQRYDRLRARLLERRKEQA